MKNVYLVMAACVVAINAQAQCRPASSMVHPVAGPAPVTQNFAAWLGTYAGIQFNGHHAGIDIGVGIGTPVRAPANGRIEILDPNLGPTSVGGTIVIRHTGPLAIPAQSGSNFAYSAETPQGLFTSFLHIHPRAGLKVGDCVAQGQEIATVTQTRLPTHLHWEVALATQQRSRSGQTFGRPSNLTSAGYYRSAQHMVDDGARDPLRVLAANSNLPTSLIADRWLWRCVGGPLKPYFGNGIGSAFSQGQHRFLPVSGANGHRIDFLALQQNADPDTFLFRYDMTWYSFPLLDGC